MHFLITRREIDTGGVVISAWFWTLRDCPIGANQFSCMATSGGARSLGGAMDEVLELMSLFCFPVPVQIEGVGLYNFDDVVNPASASSIVASLRALALVLAKGDVSDDEKLSHVRRLLDENSEEIWPESNLQDWGVAF